MGEAVKIKISNCKECKNVMIKYTSEFFRNEFHAYAERFFCELTGRQVDGSFIDSECPLERVYVEIPKN